VFTDKLEIGEIGCYPRFQEWEHVAKLPWIAALAWAKEACPDSNIAGTSNLPVRLIESPESWMNKLGLIVSRFHRHAIMIYKSDSSWYIMQSIKGVPR